MNRRRRLFASIITAAAAVALLSHCGGGGSDGSETSDYNKGGLSFVRPKIWKITSDTQIDLFHLIMLENSADDVCVITIDEPDPDKSLMDTAEEFSIDAEIDEPLLSSGDTSFSRPAAEDGWERVREEFKIKILGVATPMRRDFYRKEIGGLNVTVMLQTDIELRPGLERGLKLIRDSIEIASAAEAEAP